MVKIRKKNRKYNFKPLSFKIYSKSLFSIYRILRKIDKGMYEAQIARQMKDLKQPSIHRFIKKLEEFGYISQVFKSNYIQYDLTKLGKNWLKGAKYAKKSTFSLPVSSKNTRLHNLAMKFPILKDNPEAVFDRKIEINNWAKQFTTLPYPVGMTIEKTPKNVIVYFHQFQSSERIFMSEFYQWIIKGIYYAYYWLIKMKQIKIDIFSGEVIRQHIANERPEMDENLDPKTTTEMNLGRKAEAIFPAKFEAKAWIDRSMGHVEIETNDMPYEEKLIMMPEVIYCMEQKLQGYVQDNLATKNTLLAIAKAIENQTEILAKLESKLQNQKRKGRKK